MTRFSHQQSAHCESGVVAALLRENGVDISEPMAFGLAGAMSFAYIPIVKLGGLPLISYRMPPGHIVKQVAKRLGLTIQRETFRTPEDGMLALDQHLAQGRAV